MGVELISLPTAAVDPPTKPAAATNPTDLQELGHGVTVEWLLDHRVTATYLSEMTISSVDIWVDFTKKVLREWPVGQIYCSLTDMSAPNVRMTPYARTRAAETGKIRTDLQTFSAVILASNIFGQVLRPFINSFPRQPSSTIKVFFVRAEGLAWLEKMLIKYGSGSGSSSP